MDSRSPLDITTTDDGVRLDGELDAHTAPALQAALDDLTAAVAVIDMSAVAFVDSSGLRVLIQAHQRASAAGRELVISEPSESVMRLLEISGVHDLLDVRSSN